MATADRAGGHSLRLRVTALALAAVTIAWLIAAGMSYLRVRHEADELLDGYLVQAAAMLQARVSDELDEDELEHAPELHRYARHIVFQLWDRGRTLRLHSLNAPNTRLSPRDEGFDDVVHEGRRYRVFSAYDRERRTLVQVAEQRGARDEIVQGVGRALGMPLLVALPILGVALWWSIGAGMRPLATLSREVAARRPDNLAPVATGQTSRELAPLVASLNRLFGRLRASFERERTFTADAAHELRTPIAALRVQAQVAVGARAEPERARALTQVIVGCDRASRLVDQMLVLARVDPMVGLPNSAPCDLAAIACDAVAAQAQEALDRNVDIGHEGAAGAVRGDTPLLTILVRNLVDNALRHTPPGGAVRVRTTSEPATLSVVDTGPGVPTEALSRLGERFFRPLGEEAPGSGLGLSIVRRIAELHGANLSFEPGEGGAGLLVRVAFPSMR